MLREFTKSVGRFAQGDVRDYPKATWDQIAETAREKLDRISKPASVSGSPTSNRDAAKRASQKGS